MGIMKRMREKAGVYLYRLMESIDGEKKIVKILPYRIAVRVKLFCLKRMID